MAQDTRRMAHFSPLRLSPFQSILEHRPEITGAIGMVSVEVANLEIMFGEFFAALLRVDRELGCALYLTPQSYAARISLIENLSKASFGARTTTRDYVDDIAGRVRAVVGRRHSLIHDAWGLSSEDFNTIVHRSLPFKESNPGKPIQIGELKALIDQVRRLISEVREATDVICYRWPPYTSRKRPPLRPRDVERLKRHRDQRQL